MGGARSRPHRMLAMLAVLLILTLWLTTNASAHPHVWIYVETTFVVNDEGELTAIRQKWTYDNLLTEAVLAQLRHDAPGQEPDIVAYARQRLRRLADQDYFMRVTAGERPLAINGVSDIAGQRVRDEIHLSFTATLAQAVRVTAAPVSLKVFDPTYYIEILQDPDQPPAVAGAGNAHCTTQVKYPQPSPADYARALAIDSGVSVEPEFGALFAEAAQLVCR